MKKLALALVLFAACKSEDATKSAAAGSAEATTAGRSGKIDPGAMKPRHQGDTDDPEDDDGDDRPHRDHGGFPDKVDREAMKERFDKLRKERDSKMDLDGDGKISDDERAKARRARADQMHKRLDANSDGKLTPEELAANPRMARRFGDMTTIDANKDGEVSADEIDAAMAARAKDFADRRGSAGSGGSGSGS